MCFDPVADEANDVPLWQLFLRILYLFDYIFSGIVWIDKLDYIMKEFVSLKMIVMEIGKRRLFSYHSNGCFEGKTTSLKTWIL